MKKIKIIQISLFAFALVGLMSCAAKKGAEKIPAALLKYDEATFDYCYAEALRQKFMGNGGDALKLLAQCLRLNPQSDAVNYQISQLLLNYGDLKNGKLYAKRAYELDKKNIWYASLLAGIYYQDNKIDSAIYVYEKAVEFTPDNENIWIFLANLYSEKGDYENAIMAHRELQKKYGINENTTPIYIQVLILANKLDLALTETQEAIKIFPDEVGYYAMLAEIYGKKGESEKATEVYKQLIEENPHNSQILMSVCDFLLNEKRYYELFQILSPVIQDDEITKDEKITFFTKIILTPDLTGDIVNQTILALLIFEAVYADDDIAVLLRPELLDKYNRKTEAIKRLEEIIAKSPDNYFAWEKLLLLYYSVGDFDKLTARGEECASRFNRSFLAKILYAHGALGKERYDIALEELRKAAILAGDSEEAMMQVLVMKADVLYKMNNFTEAFKTFEEALKIDPDDIIILNNYAYYLAEHDMELKKAEEMSRKVIEQEKDNPTFLDTYAWVLFKMGKTKAAAKIMEQIISKEPNLNAEYYEHYGFILKKLRKCKQAIENWEIAIKLDSSKSHLKNEIINCGKR